MLTWKDVIAYAVNGNPQPGKTTRLWHIYSG